MGETVGVALVLRCLRLQADHGPLEIPQVRVETHLLWLKGDSTETFECRAICVVGREELTAS